MKSEFCLDHLSHKHFSSSRDRKKLRNLKPLNHTEMRMLVHHVEKDGFHTLVELINQLTEETQSLTCPQPCRVFPSECTRITLVCSREATKKKHYRRLWWINQHSKLQSPQELSALRSCAPIITDFVYKCPVDTHNKLPEDVCHIIKHLYTRQIRSHICPPFSPPSSMPQLLTVNWVSSRVCI